MATALVDWLWYFGDGTYSTEMSPKHTYKAPGTYTVKLITHDTLGNEYTLTKTNYIYVYDYPIGADGLISGYTDFCFRHAVKPAQGQGITPFDGVWVWPMILASTAKGYSNVHENLSIVINSNDMRIYRIGIPELWTDRAGTYEESEIECEAMLPEIVSRYGEHENVRHVETHVSMRAWDELRYRGADGYTADGFRDAQRLSLEAYESGEQIVPEATLQQVNRGGDYAFLKEIEARRIQIKLKYATSAFRTTRIGVHCQEIDHRTPPQLNDIPQKRWQREFSLMDLWLSRNKPSVVINRADGDALTGSGVAITGPDGKQSGFISTGLAGTLAYTTGDFTLSAWTLGDGTIFSAQISGGGTFSMAIAGNVLTVADGTDTASVALLTIGAWTHVAAVRRDGNIELYENGRLKLVQVLTAVRAYGGVFTAGNGSVCDIRRINSAVSSDGMYNYYQEVTAGGGGYLP